MKNKWRHYALKDGKIKESYIREHRDRSESRKATKASSGNSLQQSGEREEEVKLIFRPPTEYQIEKDRVILNDALVINLRGKDETVREENIAQTHQQGFERIQSTVERRSTTQEEDSFKTEGKEMKKDKESPKSHKKHEAKESKAYEKKEDRKEKAKKK